MGNLKLVFMLVKHVFSLAAAMAPRLSHGSHVGDATVASCLRLHIGLSAVPELESCQVVEACPGCSIQAATRSWLARARWVGT